MSTTITMPIAKEPLTFQAVSLSKFKEQGMVVKADFGLVRVEYPDGSTQDEDYWMVMADSTRYYLVTSGSIGWVANDLPEGSKVFWRKSYGDQEVEL